MASRVGRERLESEGLVGKSGEMWSGTGWIVGRGKARLDSGQASQAGEKWTGEAPRGLGSRMRGGAIGLGMACRLGP